VKIALIGLANSGKTTVFNALTGQWIETTGYPTTSGEPHMGTVRVPDSRLDTLSSFFRPKKTTPATIEYIDFIGLTKGDLKQNRKVFDLIKDSDAIVHVVRVFDDNAVAHPLGNTDTSRDISTVELELIFGDLELVEKRLERVQEALRHGKKPDESEKRLLLKCRDILMREQPLRNAEFTKDDLIAMKPLQFLSIIPEMIVLNCSEQHLGSGMRENTVGRLPEQHRSLRMLPLCGKIEMEIAQLSPADRKMFLDDLGLDEPAAHKLIHECFDLLGLISFFTYAGDEVRAWTIRRGTPAQKAAGKVHSDIERGFIRAEVISFDNLISAGDIHTARGKGLVRLEGKTYEVKDGDIINFRFNV
jgi:GTP-binding protein YchF